jgi:hypothetical protein
VENTIEAFVFCEDRHVINQMVDTPLAHSYEGLSTDRLIPIEAACGQVKREDAT